MTRKHYNEIVEILNEFARETGVPGTLHQQQKFDAMVHHFANMFAKDNPRFNRQRFLDAVDRFGE